MEGLLYQLVILAITIAAFYFIIKIAVKNGIVEAHKKIHEQEKR